GHAKKATRGSIRVAFVLISRLPTSLQAKPHASIPGGGALACSSLSQSTRLLTECNLGSVKTVNLSRNPPNYIHPFSAASPLTVMPPSERYGYGSWWFSFLTLPRD
ncbi:hypothetical protein QBC32DRAFT_349122, partial [Pseudoneurospora amorphoporcata]